MILLVTGRPGNGKTLLVVSRLEEWFPGRTIYYHGIKELKRPWIALDDPEKWYECPPGSVIVIDEAQQTFPVRDGKTKVPDKCARFETHRHSGLDVVLITQDAKLLDVHVRRLVGRHHHLQRSWGLQRSSMLSWEKCGDADDYHSKKGAVESFFNFPKQNFSAYHSAEVHTVKRAIPKKLYVFAACLVLLFVCVGAFIFAIKGFTSKPDVAKDDKKGGVVAVSGSRPGNDSRKLSAVEWGAEQQPRIRDIPASAPAYDDVMKVRSAPKVVSCLQSSTSCKCFTAQSTVVDVSADFCKRFVADGYFDSSVDSIYPVSRPSVSAAPPVSVVTPPAAPAAPVTIPEHVAVVQEPERLRAIQRVPVASVERPR